MKNPLLLEGRPRENPDRVERGGGWGSNARYARVSYRDYSEPADADNLLGFRLFRSQEKK